MECKVAYHPYLFFLIFQHLRSLSREYLFKHLLVNRLTQPPTYYDALLKAISRHGGISHTLGLRSEHC